MFFSSFAAVLWCVCLLIQSSIFIFPGALHNLQFCWVWLVRMGVVCGLKGYLELGSFTKNSGKSFGRSGCGARWGRGLPAAEILFPLSTVSRTRGRVCSAGNLVCRCSNWNGSCRQPSKTLPLEFAERLIIPRM